MIKVIASFKKEEIRWNLQNQIFLFSILALQILNKSLIIHKILFNKKSN